MGVPPPPCPVEPLLPGAAPGGVLPVPCCCVEVSSSLQRQRIQYTALTGAVADGKRQVCRWRADRQPIGAGEPLPGAEQAPRGLGLTSPHHFIYRKS